MKLIFFLIPLFLISLIPVSFAEIEHGINYDREILETNPDGTQKIRLATVPERILINGAYVDYHYTNFADYMQIETQHGSVILDKLTCSFDFYNKGFISGTPLFSDSIVPKMANNGTENWNEITQINDATCEAYFDEVNISLVAKKYVIGIGLLEYKYILKNGDWKTQLEATNLSSLTNKKFGFTQTINLNRDSIFWGNTTKNLDNFNLQTFNRNFLENNEAKVMNLLNDFYFDLDLAFPMLESVYVEDNGLDKSKISFNYFHNANILMPNETLIIDPTITQNAGGTFNALIGDPGDQDFQGMKVTAASALNGLNVGEFSVWLRIGVGAPAGTVIIGVYDSAFVLQHTFTSFNANTVPAGTTKFTGTTGSYVLQTDDRIGASYFSGTGANYLEIERAADVYDGANTLRSYHLNGGGYTESADDLRFELVYNTVASPWAVTDLTETAQTTTTESLDWTAPYTGGGNQVIIGYQINKTSPHSQPNTILVNDTGTTTTDYVATGLTPDTQYSFRVSAWTNNTNDHPFNNATGNILNVTTPLNSYLTVNPTNLKVYPVICDPAKLNLEWSSGAMQNINGYRIQRETPVGGGFSTIVSNTTTTTTYYNNTGLVANNNYNYRVYSLNGSGISAASNQYAHYTCHLPNAVTTLSGTATDLSTIVLTWTAPVPYGVLLGYMVNYTTPEGTPLTIFDPPHTGSSDVTETVYGLTIGADYSFRVSPVTIFGSNATGNIFNATTTTAFELGNLTLSDTTNTNDFKIFYERTDTNATSILLEVTYPASYSLTCNMLFQFSRDNNTYTGLTETPITGPGGDTDNVVSSFTFNGANTEIITVNCYDTSIPDSAKYIITITQFELLDQIANFRNGTYGTSGQIGGLDLITLIVVIIGMIGFNRVTPIAGVIFTVITVGALSILGIIEMYQIMFPALALIVLLAYTRTRQHD